jgi:hypothetical protein
MEEEQLKMFTGFHFCGVLQAKAFQRKKSSLAALCDEIFCGKYAIILANAYYTLDNHCM